MRRAALVGVAIAQVGCPGKHSDDAEAHPEPQPCDEETSVADGSGPTPTGEILSDRAGIQLGWALAVGLLGPADAPMVAMSGPIATGGGRHQGLDAVVALAQPVGRVCLSGLELTLPTPTLYASFGYDLAVGDTDADGVEDLLVGSFSDSPNLESKAGSIRAFSGPLTPPLSLEDASMVLVGGVGGTYLGAVAMLGDLDLDGREEIGAGASVTPGPDPGSIAALPSGTIAGELAYPAVPKLYVSDVQGDGIGAVVVPGTDITGDGVVELVAPAPFTSSRVDVLYGPLDLAVTYTPSDADLVVNLGEDGVTVEPAGDLDHDGLGDLVLGAPVASGPAGDRAGIAWVLRGGADAGGVVSGAELDALRGDVEHAGLGRAVLGLGDIDGDAADDLAVGVPGDAFLGSHLEGRALVFLGPISGPFEVADADLVLTNGRAASHLGFSLAAGDLDDDGRPDLVTGAPFDDSRVPDGGAVYIWTAASLF